MFKFLDVFFLIFHTLLIFFNLFGWIWRKTRLLNLISLLITLGSWIILGIFYGWGYCFLTDWHWQVIDQLGTVELPGSYVQYLILRISGLMISENIVNILTVGLLFVSLVFSVYFNFRNKIKAS